MKFTKMHGLGNDFVVIDARDMDLGPIKKKAALLADRRFGVGCDQIIVLRKSGIADFCMKIFNADGSEVEMCGNGVRCLAKYIHDKKITARKEIRFETLGGIKATKLKGKDVDVDMGAPILNAPDIPVNLQGRVVNRPLKVKDREFAVTCVSMGNPHCVSFMDSVDSFEVAKYGPSIENHALFPKRINAEFVEVVSRSRLKMRVWERGAGETFACGTGACASAVAARLVRDGDKDITVELKGGNLKIHWEGEGHPVFMRGPATTVYTGTI
ncbi:MAG: diaminopimelate epimerase [Nitrospinae bacterium]|nr:diaminopimelate epimerase [Nitrospinota bacterium]